jgi:flagellar protein FliJ
MTRFHFRLATLLRLRESTRDECHVQLAEVQQAEAALGEQLIRLQAEQEHLQHECRTAGGPGPIDLRRLLEAQRYAATLRDREGQLHQERKALGAEIDRRRQALLEADRDVRTLEKLRENQAQSSRHAEYWREGKQLDEVALQRTRVA